MARYAWEQEETGNFKRPQIACSAEGRAEKEENVGAALRVVNRQSISLLLRAWTGSTVVTGQLVRNENLRSHSRPGEPESEFQQDS